MKKSSSILIRAIPAFLILTFICTIFAFAGTADEKRELNSFNKIDIAGAYTIKLVQGNEESIIIKGDPEVIKNIITKVENGTLVIYNKDKIKIKGDIEITVYFKSVDAIESSGAVKLSSASTLKLPKLEIEMSGATSTELTVESESLDLEISGSGKVTMKGNATNVDLDISGTGNYDGESLRSENYEIAISGVGKASVNVTKNLDVEISGTGSVSYKGDPNIKQEISGMGSLKKI